MSYLRILPLFLALGAALPAQSVQGHVFSASGNPVSGATVTISGPLAAGGPQGSYVAVTGSGSDQGHYTFPPIPAGNYDLKIGYGSHDPQSHPSVALSGAAQQLDFVLDNACGSCDADGAKGDWTKKRVLTWGTLGVAIFFVINIWFVRWNNIAKPNRELLKAEVDKVRARFKTETGKDLKDGDPDTGHLWKLLNDAEQASKEPWSLSSFLFWSLGREITGWSRIYEFERDSVNLISQGSLPMITARLQAVELDLLDIDKAHAKALAGNIKDLIEKDGKEPALRAMLVEALTYLNDENESKFAQLVGWQTKAVWLVGVGCTLVVVLAFAVGNAVLFIVGAAGGYLSRMARQLKRADVPSDYGASWTTLFLSPIMGALSGWFGILLIVLLADSKLAVLGAAFQQIEWGWPMAPITLGLAFALGFSERLFDGIISSLEDKVDSDRQAATKPKQPSSSSPASLSPGQAGDQAGAAAAPAPAPDQPAPAATPAPAPAPDQPAPAATLAPAPAPDQPAPAATPADAPIPDQPASAPAPGDVGSAAAPADTNKLD